MAWIKVLKLAALLAAVLVPFLLAGEAGAAPFPCDVPEVAAPQAIAETTEDAERSPFELEAIGASGLPRWLTPHSRPAAVLAAQGMADAIAEPLAPPPRLRRAV